MNSGMLLILGLTCASLVVVYGGVLGPRRNGVGPPPFFPPDDVNEFPLRLADGEKIILSEGSGTETKELKRQKRGFGDWFNKVKEEAKKFGEEAWKKTKTAAQTVVEHAGNASEFVYNGGKQAVEYTKNLGGAAFERTSDAAQSAGRWIKDTVMND